MATIKAVLKRNRRQDGTFPIAIRVTKDRKSNFILLDYSVPEELWDAAKGRVRKGHPNSTRLNNFISKKIAELSDKAITLESDKEFVTATQIKRSSKKPTVAMFFEYADKYLSLLKDSGKYNQYTADKPRVKHFKEFVKRDLPLREITVFMLESFKAHLVTTSKLSERSAINHLSMIRSVFSLAKREEVIKPDQTPFGKGKVIIKFPETGKIGLTAEEVRTLENATLAERANHCRNIWLISYYFAGMRVSDVLRLRWSDFQDGRLIYIMGKNDKVGSLKIPEKAERILDQYRPSKKAKDDFVFPELEGVDLSDQFIAERTIAFKTSAIDKCLRKDVAPAIGLSKKLTMHIARHSFATEAGDKVAIQMLQKLYRHSSILTTIGYQSAFINKDADDALDKVLGG